MIRDALFKLVTTDDGVSDLIGTRFHPVRLPQKPIYSAVTYKIKAGNRDMTQGGPSGLVDADLNLVIYSVKAGNAAAIKRALVLLLNGYQGVIELPDEISVEIQGCFCVNEDDDAESDLDTAATLNITRLSLTFNLWYSEP